ncbi:MAG: hypothetical protein NC124_02475 [Clostridium sp.]|nr:hypothetical protein [Clostridium sp.]
MPKLRPILEQTDSDGKFAYPYFARLINKYIKDNFMTYRKVIGPDKVPLKDARGNDIHEKNVVSIPGFCCFAGIDCEEDFWKLMQHPDRKYARLGKKLVTHIKTQMQDLLVNDKNNSYASLIGKTYFPEDEDAETLTKIPEKAKSDETEVNLGSELSKLDDKERLQAMRQIRDLLKR